MRINPQKLRQLRQQKMMLQRELADKSRLSTSLIQKLERGQATGSIKTIRQLTIGLSTPARNFVDFDDDQAKVE